MKRPRRAKKIARKAAPKKRLTKAKRLAKIAALAEAAQRKIDPFHLPERLIPVGWAYQWKIKGEPVPPGWSCVPFSRHAHDFKRSANYQGAIVIDGMILMETTKDQVVSEMYAPQKLARDMEETHPARWDRKSGMVVAHFPLMDESEIVTKVRRDIPPEVGPDIDVPLSLLIRVPAKWAAAAAYLDLTISEYCRRRIVLQHAVLAQLADADGIYQPVNVHFTVNKEI